jgi:hypothetical protein
MAPTLLLATSLLLAGAPVPRDAPAPTGIALWIVDVKPGTDGKIMVQVLRTETVKVTTANGANGGAPQVVERQVLKISNVELSDIKDLKITTAGGKRLELKEAMEKLKDGATVVMTSDGKPVAVQYLRILKEDTLVFSSPELIGAGAPISSTGFIGDGGFVFGGSIQPFSLPAHLRGRIQLAPGGNPIQIVPVEAPAVPDPSVPELTPPEKK